MVVLEDINITRKYMSTAVKVHDPYKAHGLDEVSPYVLKCADTLDKLREILVNMFAGGRCAEGVKEANVMPLERQETGELC